MTHETGCRNLVLILGDQLTPSLSSLQAADKAMDRILMVEVHEETTYVRHHKKKIVFLLSAMRHFADELRQSGWTVDYVKLEDDGNTGSFGGEIERACHRLSPQKIIVTEPGEWRVLEDMKSWQAKFGLSVDILEDKRFICSRADFRAWASDRRQLRMEHFYREMRQRTGLLMDGGKPAGGKWNYDADNRKPARGDLFMPTPPRFSPDQVTSEVLTLVESRFETHFGDLNPFWFAVTRADAEAAFEAFLDNALADFGAYQDAMLKGEKFLYHSVISAYLNAGLLDPLDICHKAEHAYRTGRAPLNAVEGFIRQIIGWREYVRGIYWLKMPDYVASNALDASRPLPEFYWTGETDMLCMAEAIGQTITEAYAHHIQRLMVTGNFALLAGIDPREVHEWYLAVYADAYEWVELPNTVGMSQFADGGLLASKPYISSGNYINRMSDYCDSCTYDVKIRSGPGACPFNALYWDFLQRHRQTLSGNPRLGQVYATWNRMGSDKKDDLLKGAAVFLKRLDEKQKV